MWSFCRMETYCSEISSRSVPPSYIFLRFDPWMLLSLIEIKEANFLTRSLKSAAAHAISLCTKFFGQWTMPEICKNLPLARLFWFALRRRRRMGSKGGRHILLFFWAEILPPWPKWLSRSRRGDVSSAFEFFPSAKRDQSDPKTIYENIF